MRLRFPSWQLFHCVLERLDLASVEEPFCPTPSPVPRQATRQVLQCVIHIFLVNDLFVRVWPLYIVDRFVECFLLPSGLKFGAGFEPFPVRQLVDLE